MYDCRRIGAPVALRTAFLIPVALSTLCHGADLSFLEEFALGKNRGDSLRQLIEGTEDAYYYRALDAQSGGRLDEVDQLLPPWIEKHGRTERVVEIENRQILLRYATDPQKSLAALRERLGLRFDHQRMSAEAAASLPSRLDPALWSREALTRKALEAHPGTTDGFESSALEWLATLPLTPELRRDLLGKLNEPDVPGLAQLVVDDLNAPGSKGFGSRAIHERLLLDQLDECAALKPDLLQEEAFILDTCATPTGAGCRHPARRESARRLPRAALGVRLPPGPCAQLAQSTRALPVGSSTTSKSARIRRQSLPRVRPLPRQAPYSNDECLRRNAAARLRSSSNLNEAFERRAGFPPIANDEALVRAGLERVFREAKNPAAFAPYFDDKYFRRVQAETGLLYGMGEPGRWLATLTPAEAQALKERVDIDFAPTNRATLLRTLP
jgi:hypothetical protein